MHVHMLQRLERAHTRNLETKLDAIAVSRQALQLQGVSDLP